MPPTRPLSSPLPSSPCLTTPSLPPAVRSTILLHGPTRPAAPPPVPRLPTATSAPPTHPPEPNPSAIKAHARLISRSHAIDPTYGLTRARHIASQPSIPVALPFPPSPSVFVDSHDAPTAIPGGQSLSVEERAGLTAYLASFRRHLSIVDPSSVAAFDGGYRLLPATRSELISHLSPTDIAERGLRFVDPPISPPPFPSDLHGKAFIADLWRYADPLQLDLIADVRTQGMNLAFNPPASLDVLALAPKRPNVAKAGSPEMLIILQKVKADIAAGKAAGPFASRPKGAIAIPLFLTDKGDIPDPTYTDPSRHRLVRNWSDSKLTAFGSITAHTDAPVSSMSPFRSAYSAFAKLCALPTASDPHVVSFDQEDAYAQQRIAPGQSFLMSSHIPGFGWFVRLVGDFGHRTCGIRFEQRAKLFALACRVLSPFLRVHDSGRVVLDIPLHDDLAIGEAPRGGFGSLTAQAPLFSPAGRRRHLRELALSSQPQRGWHRVDLGPLAATTEHTWHPTSLRDVHRWVDDFCGWYSSRAAAFRAACAFAFLHRRYGFRLKASKFHLGRASAFGGVIMDGPTAALVLPETKRSKYLRRLQHAYAAEALSHNQWERLIGPPAWVSRVFDTLTPALQPFFCELGKARARSSPLPVSSSARRTIGFWAEVLRSLPPVVAAVQFADPDTPASWEVIAHVDWSPKGSSHLVGIFLLSHGLYTATPIPAWFLEAFPQAPHPSSPACETMAAYLLLALFPDIVQGRTVAIFNDNISWLLAYPSLSSPSQCLDTAMKLLALTGLTLASRLVPLFVPTDLNRADPISRGLVQAFLTATRSSGLSTPSFRPPPVLAEPPFWRRLLRL